MYDFLIVGAGLYGATMAYLLTKAGKRCIVVEKRRHPAGNIYTEKISGINVHKYGAHIFHTDNPDVWSFVQKFAVFNRFTNSPIEKHLVLLCLTMFCVLTNVYSIFSHLLIVFLNICYNNIDNIHL